MRYVVGTAGQSPRFIVDCTEEQAGHFTKDGEVCFDQNDIPPAPHVISEDGKSLVAAAIDPAVVLARKWDAIRVQRNGLLNYWSWTVTRPNSLSDACRAAWEAWFKTMDRLTVDFSDPDAVVWPEAPTMEYAG